MKSIIVTGGAGFIGANFVPYMVEKYPNYKIINLDLLTYAANLDNIKEVEGKDNYKFVKGDICDRTLVEKVFNEEDVRGVIHFAAESHVDNSITGPEAFIRTNVMGTFTLLDVARNYWMEAPHKFKPGYETCRFHHVSTDEVYGDLDFDDTLFEETTPYNPSSPYSASKASSDFIVKSYARTYGMDISVSNCSNNYGPKQHNEKLIPKIISNCLEGKSLPIYGDGLNVRDWLYVLDHCKGIDLVYHKGERTETYNIGGRNEKTNIDIVKIICSILDEKRPREDGSKYESLITYVKDRAGHDKRYAIDATKIEKGLNWKADENFETGIVKTIDWYLDNL
jgi:dTDP-glucose 4,6-dehydratase